MRQHWLVRDGVIAAADVDYVDVLALLKETDGHHKNWGLKHKPTGKYLRVRNYRGWAEYSTGDVPTLRTKSTMSYWYKRMKYPEQWEFVKFQIVPVAVAKTDASDGPYYAIVGAGTNRVMGRTMAIEDVLVEEPDAMFFEISKEEFEAEDDVWLIKNPPYFCDGCTCRLDTVDGVGVFIEGQDDCPIHGAATS